MDSRNQGLISGYSFSNSIKNIQNPIFGHHSPKMYFRTMLFSSENRLQKTFSAFTFNMNYNLIHTLDDKIAELDQPINNLVIVEFCQPLDFTYAFTTNKVITIVISLNIFLFECVHKLISNLCFAGIL